MGRPRKTPAGSATLTISLPRELIPELKRLGFSKWIADKIREELIKAEKRAQKAAKKAEQGE